MMMMMRDVFRSQAAWQVALAAWLSKVPSRDTEQFACSIVSTNNDMGGARRCTGIFTPICSDITLFTEKFHE